MTDAALALRSQREEFDVAAAREIFNAMVA